ncbi:hypothetical protein ACEQ8H_008961 [Pleosporales sp. CAS-2024a]
MRPLRLLLALSSSLGAVALLLYTTLAAQHDQPFAHPTRTGKHGGFGALLSFSSPAALFPPSAIISLTDDNSTFFLARPAAFGPLLPTHGLSAGLWIGSGFGDDTLAKGELGCGDDPAWDPRAPTMAPPTSAATHDMHALHESADMDGKVVLLKRGQCGFLAKVLWAQARGAVAVIVGDNVRGGALIRMYAQGDTSNVTIPSLFTSHTTAHLLSSLLPRGSIHSSPLASTAHTTSTAASLESHAQHESGQHSHPLMADSGPKLSWIKWFGPSKKHVPRSSHQPSHGTTIPSLSHRHREAIKRLSHSSTPHPGLWVTLTPTHVSTSPFFDTLLVLVVSPLVTLTVVYALLLLRSRIRRRRWRAPKSLVDRLPVRTYQTISDSPASATPSATSPTTPLLDHSPSQSMAPTQSHRPRSHDGGPATSSTDRSQNRQHEQEKRETGLAEWRRRYGGRQRECVVCLDEYIDGVSQVMSLPCGHEFHADCM